MTKPFTSHATWAYVAGEAGARPSLNESTSDVETMVGDGVTATWNHATGTGTILVEKKEEGKGARRALLAEATPKFKEAEEVVKKIKDKFHLDLTVEEYTAWASYEDTSRYPQKNADAIFKVDGIVRKIAPDYVYSNADAEAHYRGGFQKPYLRMGLCEFLGIKNYNKW